MDPLMSPPGSSHYWILSCPLLDPLISPAGSSHLPYWILSFSRLDPLISLTGPSRRLICAGPYQGPVISDKAPKQGQIMLFLGLWLIMPYQNPYGEVIMCGLSLSGLIKRFVRLFFYNIQYPFLFLIFFQFWGLRGLPGGVLAPEPSPLI